MPPMSPNTSWHTDPPAPAARISAANRLNTLFRAK
jgi:hypothetical protein